MRRKVTVPILPPPKYTDTTLKATSRLRGRGQACNPSSSKVPAVVADGAAGLGGWRACLPTPQSEHTTNQRSTKHIQVALDMHIERLVEGVIPMRLTSILTRAMKSRKCQSAVPQLWRWIEEQWNTTTDPTVKRQNSSHPPAASGHVSPREPLESSCQAECPWRLPQSFSSVGKQV